MNPLLKFAASIPQRLPATSRAQGRVAVEVAAPRRLAPGLSLPAARGISSSGDGKSPPPSVVDLELNKLVHNRAQLLTRMEADHCLSEPTQDVRSGLLVGCLKLLKTAQRDAIDLPVLDALQSRIDTATAAPGDEGQQARRALLKELMTSIAAFDRPPA